MNKADIKERFSYHPPKDNQAKDDHEMVRDVCLKTALIFNEILPDSREKSLAITSLEETMMWANAAIARPSADGSQPRRFGK